MHTINIFCQFSSLRKDVQMMLAESRNVYIIKMEDSLAVLRKTINLTQEQLAMRIGISRQTLMGIENKKRRMSWNIFMSLFGVFRENESTNPLLNFYGISTDELIEFISNTDISELK
jgi:DNA-binding XRE family transcriptional regulator